MTPCGTRFPGILVRCAVSGCPCPPGTPLTPHHVEPYGHTGRTSYADTAMVCDGHHHDIHEGRRALRLRDGRSIGPDGWVLR